LSLRTLVISEERARKVRPILRWIKEAAPRKREREEAAGALRAIEGVKGNKQISLSRGQEEMLLFVFEEFPETTQEAKQLTLWGPEEEYRLTYPAVGKIKPIVRPIDKLDIPKHPGSKKPVLKKELTAEEQAEREKVGMSRTPQTIPTNVSGETVRDHIAKVQEDMVRKEKAFGKRKD